MSDPQAAAEDLDADRIIEDGDDEAVAEDYPPDQPMGVDAWGTTAEEQRIGEPVALRADHEEPDPAAEI